MSSSFFSRRCRSTSAPNSSRQACISASLLSSDATASARPAASREPPAAVGASGTAGRATGLPFPAFPLRSFATGVSLDPASICRFQFLTTDASTPSSAAASRDFSRPDATATTASRFSSSGTGPCLSLRWPGASSSIHAMSSSLLLGYPSIRMVRLSRLPYSR